LCFDPEDEVSFGEAFGAYSLGAASSIVISRAGDLVRVYILGQANGVSKSKGLGTLVVERLADLFTVVLLVAALLPLFPVPSWIRLSDAFGAAVAVAALAIIYPLSRSSSRLRPPAWIEQRRLTQAAFGLLVQMLNGFSAVKDIRRALLILVSSAAVWFVQIISYAVLFPGVGIPLGLREGALLTGVLALAAIIPAPGFVGTFEFAAISVLGLFAVDRALALAYLELTRVSTLFGSGLIVLAGLAALRFSRRRSAAAQAKAPTVA